jgi:hypothetical protein
MNDVYRDTEERLYRDPIFAGLVKILFNAAISEGLTPGELKQIAFCAAMQAEQHASRVKVTAQLRGVLPTR